MRVVVSDPGVGNVRSVVRALARASAESGRSCDVLVTREPSEIERADYVVVPGQGAFGPFARAARGGMSDALHAHIARGRPYLGICLGMQVLFEASEEAPGEAGLGILRGRVKRLDPGVDPATARPFALPHIGWNAVDASGAPGAPERYFYFAHSFAAEPDDRAIVSGKTDYGRARFVSAIASGAVMGVQFHPEKSQREGLELLAGFLRL